MKIMIFMATVTILMGCRSIPEPKMLETKNPPGYECKTHGREEVVYKFGTRYLCKSCVDENIGQVELYLPGDSE